MTIAKKRYKTIGDTEKGAKKEDKIMLKPLTDRVLLKVGEPEEKTEGGLYIAANKEKPSIAEVVAVGPGKKDDDGKLIPMVVKKGDKVVINKYSGTEIKYKDEEYIIVRQDDILAIAE